MWSVGQGWAPRRLPSARCASNAIDVYPEYTGTGLLAILREPLDSAMRANPRRTFAHIARRFAEDRTAFAGLPRWDSRTATRSRCARDADRLGLRTLSDLARVGPTLIAGFTSDFIGRADGLDGIVHRVRMQFKDVRPLAPAVKYIALAESAVDVIDGYSTDGLLAKHDLVTLVDDSAFFPAVRGRGDWCPAVGA